jgi:hypothetical protein
MQFNHHTVVGIFLPELAEKQKNVNTCMDSSLLQFGDWEGLTWQ